MSTASSPLATVELSGKIATLTLRRPEARNALSLELLKDLEAYLDEILAGHAAKDARVLILTGEGKSFCAGLDLKAIMDDPHAPGMLLRRLGELMIKIRMLPMITLAKANGAAIGGGAGMTSVCDLAITHADAKIGYPEVDLGVCPAVVGPWVVRKIGAGKARRVLLSGGIMSGQQAYDIGLIDHLVPTAAELDVETMKIAERLASGGLLAIQKTKELLNEIDGSADIAMARKAAELSASVIGSEETRAMLKARLSK
jgi:methylglutaconyl-CoA hydratase